MDEIADIDASYEREIFGPEGALSAVAYAFRCWQTGDPAEGAWAAEQAYNVLDAYVIEGTEIDTNRPGAEHLILSHPVIQSELARQTRDRVELSAGVLGVRELWARAREESMTFLPESFEP